jgi:hypothetical protein
VAAPLPERALRDVVALVAAGRGGALGPAFAPLAAVAAALAGVLWALPYALWAERRLPGPDWLKGALFALLPVAVSLLVVLPLLGAGPLGPGLGAGALPALGELARHLVYGAALGLAYPVALLARPPPPVHGHLAAPQDRRGLRRRQVAVERP